MKTKLFFISMFWISMMCFSQNTYVPDDNFEQALINLGYDTLPLDDYVPTANINSITGLNIIAMNISDLTGIEDFTALVGLLCPSNNLSALDVSQNTALTELDCSYNNLSTLDVTQNTALTVLDCYGNNLSTLDVTQNTALTEIDCDSNNLSTLDVSQNTILSYLDCNNNNLSTLDVNQNTALTEFNCWNNNLSTLDVSQNTALTYLNCSGNNKLTNLDVSQNNVLTIFYCSYNTNLSSLNVKNGNYRNITIFRASQNPNLNCIEVDNVTWCTANWLDIDSQTSFSEDCSTMSVNDYSLSGFKMYPNPANELLTISLNSDANYSLMNLNGQVFKKGKITHKENTVDISNLSSGLYFIKVITDEGVITKKLIKH